ncbi:MAG: hypothetical protein KGL43_24680 [Burkholderiales bacterium]|nr:hypothetical protein [Burkholderiales bacterium]MDE2456798.1 hypothetical protein [Burkholderiales bacterium]
MIDIIRFTPPWVWLLLAALVALGLAQTRTRRVTRGRLLALPLAMMALGLASTATALAANPAAASTWLAGLAAFGAIGLRLPRPAQARWLVAEQRLELPGSFGPLALMLSIFALRYVSAVALVLHPDWRSLASVQAALAASYGALAGLFLGRALSLLRPTLSPQARIVAHEFRHRA